MSETITVETSTGRLRGAQGARGGWAFLGAPFGANTSGANRFRAPKPRAPWAGIRDALAFGPFCPQVDQRLPPEDSHSLTGIPAIPDEDCLNLNLWTPDCGAAARRPVMVWLHAGGFSMGSNAHPMLDGSALSQYGDVVVVSVGHRLGALGYLLLDDGAADGAASSANVGLLDIVLALEWLRDNVAAFGGDPENITLFGCSGGGRKISVLMAMPAAAGLFHRAIVQSGAHPRCIPRETATRFVTDFCHSLDANPALLRDAPVDELCGRVAAFAADWSDPANGIATGRGLWALSPVVDGTVLRDDPWIDAAPEESRTVPLLIGTTADEAGLLMARQPDAGKLSWDELTARCHALLGSAADAVLKAHAKNAPDATPWELLRKISGEDRRLMSIAMAERKSTQTAAPAFMYIFNWTSDLPYYGAAHTIDLPFLFRTLRTTPLVGRNAERMQMADLVCDAWIAFARNGNPSCVNLGTWPTYEQSHRCTMILDVPPRVVQDPMRAERLAWGSAACAMPWEETAFVGSMRRSVIPPAVHTVTEPSARTL